MDYANTIIFDYKKNWLMGFVPAIFRSISTDRAKFEIARL